MRLTLLEGINEFMYFVIKREQTEEEIFRLKIINITYTGKKMCFHVS
jgi:hypothetical protein